MHISTLSLAMVGFGIACSAAAMYFKWRPPRYRSAIFTRQRLPRLIRAEVVGGMGFVALGFAASVIKPSLAWSVLEILGTLLLGLATVLIFWEPRSRVGPRSGTGGTEN